MIISNIKKIFFALIFSLAIPTAASATDFTPTSISGLSVWYNVSQANSVHKTGSAISSVDDLSGNHYNLTSIGTNSPTYNPTGMNGFPTMTFDGSSNVMASPLLPDTLLGGPNGATVFLVGNVQSNGVLLWSGPSPSSQSNSAHLDLQYINTTLYSVLGVSDAYGYLQTNSAMKNQNAIFEFTGGNSSSLTESITYNGTLLNSRQTNTFAPFSCDLAIGALLDCTTGLQYYMAGNVSQVLIYNRILTTQERQEIEGYLSCSYGLQSSLPPGSPYTDYCPPAPPASFIYPEFLGSW